MPTATDDSKSAAVVCDHCGLTVPEALIDHEAEAQFCCGGCAVAYETIHRCGLDDYYAVRDRLASELRAASSAGKRYASYDSEAFLKRHATRTDNGLCSVDLRLEGVHCAACVWLVERLPRVAPGVIESRLSLGSARARIVWDPEQTPLSKVATQLDRFGYASHPARDASARSARDAHERKRLVNLAVAGALAGNNMLIAVALYAGVFEGIEPQFLRLFRWLSMGIGLLSLAWPGRIFFRGAWGALRTGTANLDQPIALALAVGAVAGAANVLLDRGEVYFDSLSALVFLLLAGRFLQARQQRWAEEAVGLMLAMTPDACRLVRDGKIVEESIEALEPDDEVEVRPGELFPADGRVLSGRSTVDQSLLTGESLPTPVEGGDEVFAGAQNVASTLRVVASRVGDETRVGKLVRMVEEGLATKPSIVRFADRVAGWFVGAVVLLGATNLAWWSATRGLGEAIDATVALLIVACPCALGLATPLTMAVAIGRGSKHGVLIKSATVLERIAGVTPSRQGRLFVDKTGTLTTGRLGVESFTGKADLGPWVAAIEAESNHPIARALVEGLGPADPAGVRQIQNRVETHGHGVEGDTPLGRLLVGSPRFAEQRSASSSDSLMAEIERAHRTGETAVVVAIDGAVVGVARLSDRLHADSRGQIEWLQRAGWQTELLSGDAEGPVRHAGDAIGLKPDMLHATVSPEGKLARVREAAAGDAPVMMVGDGVNDAAALAAADIGVAVHGGAEASLAAADVYMTEPGIGMLASLVRLSRDTMRVARRNLLISLAYNAVAAVLAMAGWVSPLAAAVLMPLSSATVLASAAWFKWQPVSVRENR